MGKLRPFVRKDSYMPNKKWIPFVIGNGYTTTDGASGPAPEYETVTGNPVSFNAIIPFPLKQLSVAFSPVQSGTGDPSPDNVRPILGWDSLNVEQRGKNLFDEANADWKNGYLITAQGTESQNNLYKYCQNYIPVLPETTYAFQYVKKISDSTALSVPFYDENKNFIRRSVAISATPVAGLHTGTVTTPSGCHFLRLSVEKSTNISLMIEVGETATTYEPYNGRSISITIGQTVYSGTVDVLTGVVTLNMAHFSASWGDGAAATVLGNFERRRFTALPVTKYPSYTIAPISNIAPYKQDFASDSLHFYINSSNSNNVLVFLPVGTSGSTQIEIVYELVTPIEIQLTPQEVESLLGENVLFSDANGDLTVEYRSN